MSGSLTYEKSGHEYITIVCSECGYQIQVPVYCGNRFCDICSFPRRNRVRHRLDFLISATKPLKSYSHKFLTLSEINQSSIKGAVNDLTKAFSRFRNRVYWKRNVKGGAYVIEITGRPGSWNAHIHAIIFARFMPHKHLLKQWQACSNGSNCHISQPPTKRLINYLTKYLSKNENLTDFYIEIGKALKGFRLFSPFGTWFKLNQTYVKPTSICPKCHESMWIPLEILYYRDVYMWYYLTMDAEHRPKDVLTS